MTDREPSIIEKACWERGCACYDHRLDEGVEVTLVREWQGLTEDEYNDIRYGRDKNGEPYVDYELFDEGEYGMEVNIYVDDFYRAIEAKLKEKNNAI